MFLPRLITSLILVPLVLLLIFYGHFWLLLGIVLLIFIASGRESLQLIPVQKLPLQIGYLALLLAGLWLCGLSFPYWLIIGLGFWAFNVVAILTFPQSQQYWGYPWVVALLCFILLPLFIQSLMHLYYLPQGKGLLVYLLCLIWASDVGAYLSGKLMGKHKMIPQVSPGKSWEGVGGGLFLALIVAAIAWNYLQPAQGIIYWFTLALGTVIISIFGDLFISILKRRCGLKDTGTLIPGHGGILDRLDSLIAALPLFYFGLTWG